MAGWHTLCRWHEVTEWNAAALPPHVWSALANQSAACCFLLNHLLAVQDDDNMKEALRYSAALLGELRTSLLRWVQSQQGGGQGTVGGCSGALFCVLC